MNIDRLEKKLEKLSKGDFEDEKTKKFKFNNKKFKSLSSRSKKKPEYALIQYLRNNRRVDFMLSKIVSGNIIVINNKGHELNPKDTWIHKKNIWYIVREKDTRPVSVTDKVAGWETDDHQILMKMVLGAVQKKVGEEGNKNIAKMLIVGGVVALILYIIFGGG